MRLRQTLICFFLLSLREGSTALFGKDIGVRTATEGGKITVKCTFTFSGSRKVFCRNDCEDGDILVETSGVINWSGRYSIEYKEGNYPQTSTLIYVRITNLTKSDSGRYSCWLGRNLSPDSTETFELQVKNASASTMRTTLTLSYTSTSSTTSKAFQITNESEQQPSTSGPDLLLYLSLLLVLLFVIFSVILLIYCRRRAHKPKAEAAGLPFKTEYAEISVANQIYEEIREDEPDKSPPGDISTVYTCAKFSKPHEVQTTDEYSLAGPQTEDDSSKLTYSTVDFSNRPASTHNSAPSGGVIYSVPRVDASSEDALYSTVTLH